MACGESSVLIVYRLMLVNTERFQRALCSLQGLAVGDAFGSLFTWYDESDLPDQVRERRIPDDPWEYSDDTMMALSIVENLRDHDGIDQDALAASFAEHYQPGRGYGPAMHRLLTEIYDGASWRKAAPALFDGQGSYGNGAAMRVAPLGAYFADDLALAARHAALSALVTHCHKEAAAGAIAVAIATALAWRAAQEEQRPSRAELIDAILPFLPECEVRENVVKARDLPAGTTVPQAVAVLGNGGYVTVQDTVPIALWSAGEHLDDFETAMWKTLCALGDIDTNCAIVGGIVASYTGLAGIPKNWLLECEPIPEWVLSPDAG